MTGRRNYPRRPWFTMAIHRQILDLAQQNPRPRDIARVVKRSPEYVCDVLRKLRRHGLLAAPVKWVWTERRRRAA